MARTVIMVAVVLLISGCTDKPSKPAASIPASRLASVDLQEGFDGSTVHLTWRGRTVYTGQPKTNELLGIAEAVQFDFGDSATGLLALQVGALSFERNVNWNEGHVVGLSIHNGELRLQQQNGGFGYD
jgi:hypothetical protein